MTYNISTDENNMIRATVDGHGYYVASDSALRLMSTAAALTRMRQVWHGETDEAEQIDFWEAAAADPVGQIALRVAAVDCTGTTGDVRSWIGIVTTDDEQELTETVMVRNVRPGHRIRVGASDSWLSVDSVYAYDEYVTLTGAEDQVTLPETDRVVIV